MAYSLEEMEEYLQDMYEKAGKGLEQKAVQYMLDFQRLEEQHKRDVENGKWTQEQFDTWRKNKLLYGMHWTRMIQTVQRDMVKVNQTALDYINGKIPQIFAQTYNEVAEKVPKSPVSGYSFELVNADTVKNLIHEEGIILPPKKNLDKQKDKLWNAKQVNAQLLQGILQGESIKKIAARMQNVANADLVGATRTARTMCTAAENSGRQSAYNRAAEDGIKFTKTWVAALQGNTRDTHKYLNQQTQPHDKPFESSSGAVLMFPGDWHAPPAEVYNCRCTMITNFIGFDKVKLKEAVKRQEAVEEQVAKEQSIENLQYVSDINNIRDIFNQTTDAEERDKLLQEAGRIMGARHKEYYDRIDDLERRIKEIANQYDAEIRELRKEYDRLRKEEVELMQKSMETIYGTPARKEADAKVDEATKKKDEAWAKYLELDSRIGAMKDELRKEKRTAILEMLEFRKDMLKEIRECGVEEHKRTEFFSGTKAVQEVLYGCLADYPKEWVDALREAGKLNCAEVQRGFYNHYDKKIRIDSGGKATGYHEEGHAFERNVTSILEAEKYFYERRTEGEELVWMGPGYDQSEKTRKDDFMSWYMGKDYYGNAYELVSMGFESYFTNSYYLKEDEDYSNFIMGVLALC